ncbi:MAG TPA: BON domain-containing protein [Bryobacteraceae bacterium]|jgi:hyperosmotically inducible protein
MMKKVGLLLALGSAFMFGAPTAGSSGTVPKPLEARVQHELLTLPYYNVFDDLSFRVDHGTVILFGQVTQPVVKDDAERVVKHLEGVSVVKNEIEVLPLSDFDNQIRWRTYFAIYGYGPLERYSLGVLPPIRIIVKNGNVTLLGSVDNEMDKNVVYIRANGVPGVFSVTNDLKVM